MSKNIFIILLGISVVKGQNIHTSNLNQDPFFSEYTENGIEVSVFLSPQDSVVFEKIVNYPISKFDPLKGRKIEMYINVWSKDKAISKTAHIYGNNHISLNSVYLDKGKDLYFLIPFGDSIFMDNKLIAFNPMKKDFYTYLFKYEIETGKLSLCKEFIGAWEFGRMSSNSEYLIIASQVVDSVSIDNYFFKPHFVTIHSRNILIAKINKTNYITENANIFLCWQDFFVYNVKIDHLNSIYCILDCYGKYFLYNNDTFKVENPLFGTSFILKLDSELSLLSINNTSSLAKSVSYLNDGSFVVHGDYINNLTLNGNILKSNSLNGSSYIFLFDDLGKLKKYTIMSGNKSINSNLIECIDDKIFLAGQYEGGFFNRDTTLVESLGSNNAYLLIFDSNLEKLSSNYFNGDSLQTILNVILKSNVLEVYGRSFGNILYCNDESFEFIQQPYQYTGKQFLYRRNNLNLNDENINNTADSEITIDKLGNTLNINSNGKNMSSIEIFNIFGQSIYSKKLNTNSIQLGLNQFTGYIIFSIQLEGNTKPYLIKQFFVN